MSRDSCGDFWVGFSCDGVPAKPLPSTDRVSGIDLGLEKFLATSDGAFVENPRHLRSAELALKRTRCRVSKCQKGSKRRQKLCKTLARQHRRVQRARQDFHFKIALFLLKKYDVIAVEDLNVRGLAAGMFAKSVHDAGWGQFLKILCAKAEEAARTVILVNPKGTSQVCSNCGCAPAIKKTLADRIHQCLQCGLNINRDINAAINVLHKAILQILQKVGSPSSASGLGSKTYCYDPRISGFQT